MTILSNQKNFKLYFQVLSLTNNPELIQQYISVHAQGNVWPEVTNGIKQVGIHDMQIFLFDNHCLMIVKTPPDFRWEESMKTLSGLPRQAEWEAYVSALQGVDPNSTSDEKWKMLTSDEMYRMDTIHKNDKLDYLCYFSGMSINEVKDKLDFASNTLLNMPGIQQIDIIRDENLVFLVFSYHLKDVAGTFENNISINFPDRMDKIFELGW